MESTTKDMAPSLRCPLYGTGVLRITGGKYTQKPLKIATWNVRSLKQHGKLDNVIKEMKRLDIKIMGISDTKWPEKNRLVTAVGSVLYHSGSDVGAERCGVAILLDAETAKAVKKFVPLSSRSMLVSFEGKPCNINIIQVYAPTADKPQKQMGELYKEIETLLQHTQRHDINIIMGDFNAKVGSEETPRVTGSHGLGTRNDRVQMLVDICQGKEFVITNTLYKLHPRRLYT